MEGKWTKSPDPVKLVCGIAMLGAFVWELTRDANNNLVILMALAVMAQIADTFHESSLGKGKWRKKPDPIRLTCGIVMLGLLAWQVTLDVDLGLVLMQMILALQETVLAFYELPLPAVDPRPLKERYEEMLRNSSNEDLQKILNDSMRGDEIKEAAGSILEKRKKI